MEALSRLVTESLVRHGFDRPLDYRRLHWSRWFRCESHHSLLFVPSQPGVFAVAEEITSGAPEHVEAVPTHVATGASPVPRPLSEAKGSGPWRNAVSAQSKSGASAPRQPNRKPRLQPLSLAVSWPSPSFSKTTTWPSFSTACSPPRIPCAPAWSPAAISSVS